MSESTDATGEIVRDTTDDGLSRVRLRAFERTAWRSQLEIAELFQSTKQNITLHTETVLADGGGDRAATVTEYLTVQTEDERSVSRTFTLYKEFNERELLTHAGVMRAGVANRLAKTHNIGFDAKRRMADAVEADAVDLAELERLSRGKAS
jgi:hypothetical protein